MNYLVGVHFFSSISELIKYTELICVFLNNTKMKVKMRHVIFVSVVLILKVFYVMLVSV